MIYDKDRQGNNIINVNTDFITSVGEDARKHSQDIPNWHLDNLKEQRLNSTSKKEGEFMKVASIPTAVIEKWMREGFNVMTDKNITAKQIVNKLKNENLDAFLTTEKSL
ncbi:hypothetical protein OAI36_00330 [Alphaproteobacteria bacterium]|nr:hypothetical protein [Alphaproteobacteria bacterium]|tara:strand:+ start:798 stop:1124 length:327 start_codon:yes stop_codon:yes gene_type:complete